MYVGLGFFVVAVNTFKSEWSVFALVAQFPIGFSVAASVRVGNALGAGRTDQARLSCKVSLLCACTSQLPVFLSTGTNGCHSNLCHRFNSCLQ